jgi:LysR family transcriptional regulator, glycine cleavage system transcriptional activator
MNRHRVPSTTALRAFESVARNLSFTRAAEELGMTQGAISYQVKQLGNEIGAALFRWDGRTLVLTDEARKLLPVVQRSLTDIGDAIAAVSSTREHISLSVASSTYFAAHWLSKRFGKLWQQHPGIGLRLQHPEFPVDFAKVDLTIRWIKEGWDNPAVRTEKLFLSDMFPVCSPELRTAKAPLLMPSDLHKHKLLRDEALMEPWASWFALAGIGYPKSMQKLSVNDPNVYLQAAIDGQGIALGDTLLADEIALGRLIKPFDLNLPGYGYFLVYPSDALRRKSVRAFREWLLEESRSAT